MKRIIALILVLVSCFSVLMTACGGDDSASGKPFTPEVRKRYQGTHIFNVSESNSEYLVQNSSTQYKILLPAESTDYTDLAASELQTLFREATGASLIVERESGDGYTHDANQKFISIGNTALFASTQMEVDKDVLKRDGYRIVTKDKNIYIFTTRDIGNLYGVYELMEILFNFDYFYVDCYQIDKNVVTVNLPILDVTDVPDFSVRINQTQIIRQNSYDNNAVHRMRITTSSITVNVADVENGQPVKSFHNSAYVLPKYQDEEKTIPVTTDEWQWHADEGDQLCYTAHGDAESYDRMVKRAAYVVGQSLMRYPVATNPDQYIATISCMDERSYCNCDSCGAEASKYGSNAAAVLKFINAVRREVDVWMEKPENAPYKRDFYLMFFAYFAYLNAPAHYDETQGKYVLNEDLYFEDGVGVMYAINDVTSTVSMYHENNAQTKKNSEMWFDVSPATYIWSYSGNLNYSPSMWPSYEHLDEDGYNFFACAESVYYSNYKDYKDEKHTGFKALKLYIDSKMMWDCSQSIAELKAKWFKAMFGEVSDIMLDLFERELLYVTQVYEKERVSHSWGVLFSASDWALTELEVWIRMIQKAHDKAAKIYKESDPETYEMIKNHINDEFYFPALALVMSQTKETGGQIYIDTVKYLQANFEFYSGHRMRWSKDGDTNTYWKDIIV